MPSLVKGKCGLILPQKTGKVSSDRELSVASLQQWRSQLKLSDVASSAKALYVTLQDCYQSDLSNEERFEILGFLRPTVNYLCQSLQKYYHHQETLSDNQRLIGDLVYILYIEMINGYKLVIEDTSQSFFFNKKLLMASLQNAMHYCTKVLFHAYEQHRNPPLGIWLDLHSLYLLAQKKRVEQKSLLNVVDWNCRFNTIGDMYKHALLFAIANPYRLRRDECTHLIYALEAWAPLLNLKKLSDKISVLFVVDFTNDSGPKSTLYFQSPPGCFTLILNKINDRLHKLVTVHQTNQDAKSIKQFTASELALPPSLIESLFNLWHATGDATRERQKVHGFLSVCLGITSCHWYIGLDQAKNLPSKEESTPQDNTTTETINIDMLPSSSTADTKTMFHPIYHCELIDQSESGYCLKWVKEVPAQLQCGEIIGLERKSPAGERIWSIGTIRWLKSEEDNSIFLGIQILSAEALAVKARLVEASSTHAIATLLFPEQSRENKPMTLITPILPFKKGHEIELEFEGKTYPTCLQKNYSLSPSYHEFGVEFLYEHLVFPNKISPEEILTSIPLENISPRDPK